MGYTKFPTSGGAVVEPLTLTQLLTLAAAGVKFAGGDTLTESGSFLAWSGGSGFQGASFVATGAAGVFRGNTTQSTATIGGLNLYGFASNQVSQHGVDLGIQTAWTHQLSQVILRVGYGVTGAGGGTFPWSLMATGKQVYLPNSGADIAGTATLVSGTVVVASTSVETGDLIFVSVNTPGGTVGIPSAPVASIINATSFVINSSSGALDTSTVNWEIKKKATV